MRPALISLPPHLSQRREAPAAAGPFRSSPSTVGNHTGAFPVAPAAAAAHALLLNAHSVSKSAPSSPATAVVAAPHTRPPASLSSHAAKYRPTSCHGQREGESEDDSPIKPKYIAKSKLLSDSEEEDKLPVKRMGVHVVAGTLDPRERVSLPVKASVARTAGASHTKMEGQAKKSRMPSSSSNSRRDESSDSSTYSDVSSETSSSDRSDSSDTSGDSNSSGSSQATSSESGDSEEERLNVRRLLKPKRPPLQRAQTPPKRAKLQNSAQRKAPDVRSRSKSQELSGDEEEGAQIKMGTFDPRNRTSKAKRVAQLLCRWWYVLPEWPPANFDYVTKLNERRLQLVSLEEYEDLDDVDEKGFTKVYQISAFPGVFRDPQGRAIDLRPEEGRPCYSNLIRKSEHELLQLVEAAIKNQMESLKESAYDERKTHKKLQSELNEVTRELGRFRAREEFLKKK